MEATGTARLAIDLTNTEQVDINNNTFYLTDNSGITNNKESSTPFTYNKDIFISENTFYLYTDEKKALVAVQLFGGNNLVVKDNIIRYMYSTVTTGKNGIYINNTDNTYIGSDKLYIKNNIVRMGGSGNAIKIVTTDDDIVQDGNITA